MLDIFLTKVAVHQIKVALQKSLPDVKSSHRVEAIGRGLGFNTYAALLASSRAHPTHRARPSGPRFAEYLAKHGLSIEVTHFYRAVATAAISTVLETEPRLSMNGYGFGPPRRNPDRTWQTPSEKYDEFVGWREEFFGDDAAHQFLLSLALLQRIPKTRTIRQGRGSYKLKHIAENYRCTFPEGAILGPHYVSNGILIVAAKHLGFRYKNYVDHLGYDVPNVAFNMPQAIIDNLDAEIRPSGAVAQDRRRRDEWRQQKQSFLALRRNIARESFVI